VAFWPLAFLLTRSLSQINWDGSSLRKALRTLEMRQVKRSKVRFSVLALGFLAFQAFVFSGVLFTPESRLGINDGLPTKLQAVISDLPAPAKIFHSPDLGGLMALSFPGKRIASMDDRNLLNGKQAYLDFFTVSNLSPGWRDVLRHQKISHILLKSKASKSRYKLDQYFANNGSEFEKLYLDENWAFFRLSPSFRRAGQMK